MDKITARDYPPGETGQAGQQPWFCWFNQTVLEFFIYPNKNTTTGPGGSMPTATSPANVGVASTTLSTSTHRQLPAWPSITPGSKARRDANDGADNWRDNYPDYPRYIKLGEKRKPGAAQVPPYCQQMDILDDGQIVPAINSQVIDIVEIEPEAATNYRRDIDNDGTPASLSSNCVCEWLAMA